MHGWRLAVGELWNKRLKRGDPHVRGDTMTIRGVRVRGVPTLPFYAPRAAVRWRCKTALYVDQSLPLCHPNAVHAPQCAQLQIHTSATPPHPTPPHRTAPHRTETRPGPPVPTTPPRHV